MSEPVEDDLARRLEAVREAAARDRQRSPEEVQRVLEARARILARVTAADDGSEDLLELLLVRVGDEQLAVPVASIVAIARATAIAPLPRAVRPVYGVTGWRGRTLTVLSLSADARPALTATSRLVVLGAGARAALALVVDEVDDVRRVPRGSLSRPQRGPRQEIALGVTPDGLLVVNGDALLHPDPLAR